MAKSKRPFWQILDMVDQLSAEQRLDLLEKLSEPNEGKEQKKERKSRKPPDFGSGMAQAVRESIESVTCATPNCGLPEDAPVHHPDHEEFHKFRATIKRKAAGAEG